VVELCASTLSMKVSLGCVAQRGFSDGRDVLDSRRLEAFVWCHDGVDDRLARVCKFVT
jgi:hypothetical protein